MYRILSMKSIFEYIEYDNEYRGTTFKNCQNSMYTIREELVIWVEKERSSELEDSRNATFAVIYLFKIHVINIRIMKYN